MFAGSTTLAELKRTPQELLDYLYRDNSFPHGCYLMTGTGIVPPDGFTLASGDRVAITILRDRHPRQPGRLRAVRGHR